LAALYFGIRHRDKVIHFIKQLIAELRAVWQSILQFFAGKPVGAKQVPAKPAASPASIRPFAAFHDPFESGDAARWSPDRLVRFSFEALEAWASERGQGRGPEETPLEFARALADADPTIADDARALANLYAEITYARRQAGPNSLDLLRRLWLKMKRVPASVSQTL
jgi:hypothetical protein